MKKWIEKLKLAEDDLEKIILLGAWLSEEAERRNIKPPVVIVGGSAVEIYTFGY